MIYSVYNYDAKAYDYYEGPGPRGTHAGAPPISSGRNELGATVEQAAWKVPPGARKVGSGDLPQGRIASLGGGFGGIGELIGGDGARAIGLAAVAYLAWRFLR